MDVLILFTSHRVEMLPHFEEEAKKRDVIIIEEPRDEYFQRMLEESVKVEEYVHNLNTSFPVYSKHQCEILRRLHGMGKKIYQSEPYLEALEVIHKAIEKGEFERLPRGGVIAEVQNIERTVNEAWLDYQEAFIKKDFDALVDATVRFTKADAERFKIRDRMRAEEVAKIIEESNGSVLIEAGQIHILLPKYLEELGFKVSTLNLPEVIAKMLGIELYPNPGNELTKKFMLEEDVDDDTARVMAARGIMYISLIPKEEMLPSEDNPYPHLIEENKVAKAVSKLSYEGCRKLFYKIWL